MIDKSPVKNCFVGARDVDGDEADDTVGHGVGEKLGMAAGIDGAAV